jgi:pimeloyl-ACP methyl ester carboxylesterase
MSPIVFSHANSFGASTYRVLFDNLKTRGYDVHAIEKYGHDENYPITNNWPHVMEQLNTFAKDVVAKVGEPVWLVGHSLGGFLSLMTAARHPELTRGVVLIDSPIVGGWRSTALGVAKSTQLMDSFSPGSLSHKRRNSWPNTQAVYEHFRNKKAFAKWDDQVLWDYVNHGTHEVDGKRVLSFDRAIETRFYNTVPDHLQAFIKRHPLKCLVTFIGGSHSAEMKQVGMALTEKITKGRTIMLDGSHLFPMEKPLATAAAIETAIRNMGGDMVGNKGG